MFHRAPITNVRLTRAKLVKRQCRNSTAHTAYYVGVLRVAELSASVLKAGLLA